MKNFVFSVIVLLSACQKNEGNKAEAFFDQKDLAIIDSFALVNGFDAERSIYLRFIPGIMKDRMIVYTRLNDSLTNNEDSWEVYKFKSRKLYYRVYTKSSAQRLSNKFNDPIIYDSPIWVIDKTDNATISIRNPDLRDIDCTVESDLKEVNFPPSK